MAAVPEIRVNCEQPEELLPPVNELNLSLCPFRRVALVMCVVVMQPSSVLALLNLSTLSLCLTGEASHMD